MKKHILTTAKILAEKHGISNINIRMVAKESGIALGTIYNYYPAKGDIIAAVIGDFWKNAFANIDFISLTQLDFITALEQIYYQLLNYLNSFKENWLEQLVLLNAMDKSIGREKEKEYLSAIHSVILKALEHNKVALELYSIEERISLSQFIFENIVIMLRRSEPNFNFFKKILTKLLSE